MSKLPSMPLFVDAYLADTTHLSLEEHGAYLLLLMAMWRRGGAIPDNDVDTARMLGLMPRPWLRLKARLMPMLSVYGIAGAQMLSQAKLQKQWNYAVENRERQSEKGKRGAEERWQRKQLLESCGGNGTGIGPGNSRQIASISNKNISSNSISGEGSERDLTHLLKTPLMKGTA